MQICISVYLKIKSPRMQYTYYCKAWQAHLSAAPRAKARFNWWLTRNCNINSELIAFTSVSVLHDTTDYLDMLVY